MIWQRLRGRKANPVEELYASVVTASRQERFYQELAVPDTVDGRFDMIVLHLFVLLERLRGSGQDHAELRQGLTDAFFKDMDRSLREMGVGDLSVGKKVRMMAEAFYGRMTAYTEAVAAGETALAAAFNRNIYAGENAEAAASLARVTLAARKTLEARATERVIAGSVNWQ
jgi:cytochrome b pre-mRNA-processing protein 3